MTELALTVIRLVFLIVLWGLVLIAVGVLRRDLRAPREARPLAVASRGGEPTRPKPAKTPKAGKSGPRTLLITGGALEGTVIPLGTSPITLGRAPESTVVLDDDYASNRHARLTPAEGGRWIVEDLGSTNGTWLDRARITTPMAVPLGVPIKVGRTTLELRK
jgi:pSer/pThr/pTyr-binding forkhead associated (FHA) protein